MHKRHRGKTCEVFQVKDVLFIFLQMMILINRYRNQRIRINPSFVLSFGFRFEQLVFHGFKAVVKSQRVFIGSCFGGEGLLWDTKANFGRVSIGHTHMFKNDLNIQNAFVKFA